MNVKPQVIRGIYMKTSASELAEMSDDINISTIITLQKKTEKYTGWPRSTLSLKISINLQQINNIND